MCTRDGTTALLLGRRGRVPREVLRTDRALRLGGLSADGTLIAPAGSADDTAAVIVVTGGGRTVAELPGAGGREGWLWCQGFRPRPGDRELLLVADLGDRYAPATWTPETGLRTHSWCAFDTEISVRWWPLEPAVLVRQDRHGRSLLHHVDLDTRRRTPVPTPAGSLLDAAPRPGGAVDYPWTDTAHPPVLRRTEVPDGGTPSRGAGPARTADSGPRPSHRTVDAHGARAQSAQPARGPGHRAAPGGVPGPRGPADHDRDADDAALHTLVASGCAVARVNYRGSTGLRAPWRHAFPAGVGHTQVEDLAAVGSTSSGRE